MSSGGYVQPGVKYPRQIPAPEGLPEGWTAFEYSYKSGIYLGRTFVRFNSQHKKDLCTSIKQAVAKDAMYGGASKEEADEIAAEWLRARDEKVRQQKEEKGYVSKEVREEAIKLFHETFGSLDGPTTAKLPGWKAVSVYRETCNQTAVTYYNPEGKPFGTVKDVEAFLGVRLKKGEDLTDFIAAARGGVVYDDKGRAIHEARQEIQNFRTAEDYGKASEDRQQKAREARALMHNILPEHYKETPEFSVTRYTTAGDAEAEAAMKAAPVELLQEAKAVSYFLAGRGFSEKTEILMLHGIAKDHAHAVPLSGIFYERPGPYGDKPYYQQAFRHERGPIACRGVYVFWSPAKNQWHIGALDENGYPFAYLSGARPKPWSPGDGRWQVYAAAPADSANGAGGDQSK